MDITINPFITSGKIPAELFCDRKEETKTLIRKMTSGANIVLMSPRRVGKTQLIYHCFDKPVIKDNYIVFFVDILKTSSIQEFTYELGKSVFNTLASKGQKMQKLTPEFAAEGMKVVQTPEAQNKIQEIFLRYMKKE